MLFAAAVHVPACDCSLEVQSADLAVFTAHLNRFLAVRLLFAIVQVTACSAYFAAQQ
jgi:hypothetical protein